MYTLASTTREKQEPSWQEAFDPEWLVVLLAVNRLSKIFPGSVSIMFPESSVFVRSVVSSAEDVFRMMFPKGKARSK